MPEREASEKERKPWYGKTCAKCDAPLNYAQAAKGMIPGLCGKCTDEVRRRIVAEARGGREGRPEADSVPREPRLRAGPLLAAIAIGLLLGFAAAVAAAAFAPERFAPIVDAARRAAGR